MFASRCIRRTFPRRKTGRGSGMEDSLYFSEQHLAVRNMVREFARGEVAPVAAELDAKAEFPWANVKKMGELGLLGIPDRKSTRLNSSHSQISYAVFCLKKKNKKA